MAQYAFYFDGTRCTGCKTCEFSCKDYKNLDLGIAYRKVYEVTGGETTRDANGIITTNCVSYPLSLACHHCDKPVCVDVCPTGAMNKDDNGIVSVDADRCIGCGYCHMACPYNAPKVDREKGHSVKCDACMERLEAGEKPVCVEACPARALDFTTAQEASSMGDRGAIVPLPDPSYTEPNIFIKPSEDASRAEGLDAKITNPLEVQ